MKTKKTFYQYGAVASGHRLVSEVGLEILRAGGNAFDAVIACGFASSVCEPMLSSLGGGGFLLTYNADGQARLFDFFSNHSGLNYQQLTGQAIDARFMPITVNFPGSAQVFQSGIASVATPGCLHGYFHVHQRLGRLPMRDIVQPAVELAKNGVKLTAFQAYVHSLLKHVLLSTADSRAIFAVNTVKEDGREERKEIDIKKENDIIVNEKLGDVIEVLAIEGADLFYRGEVAQQIVKDMLSQGGFVTPDDLESYRTIERQPLLSQNAGGLIYGNPLPSLGSTLAFKQLEMLRMHHQPSGMLDVDSQRKWLANFKAVEVWRMEQEKREQQNHAVSNRAFTRGTTHVSVIDKAGNCASMTTSNGEGSGYVIPETGIMLNNMMGEDDLHPHGFYAGVPGQRIASMMAPTIAVSDKGEKTVLGTGGSKRIRSAIAQVLWLLQQGHDLTSAIKQGRMHYDGEKLQCEPGYQPVLSETEANYWAQTDMYFGGVHAVSSHYPPVGDERREGYAVFQ